MAPRPCADQREPLPPRPRHPRHRLPHRRPDRGQARHRAHGHDPGAGRHLLRPGRGHGARAIAACPRRSWWTSPQSLLEVPGSWSGPPSAWSSRPARWSPTRWRGSAASSWPACTGPSGRSPSGCGTSPSARRPGRRSTPSKAIPWVEGKTGLTLAESQRAAVRLALAAKVLVITGGPGVGKTTLVNSILKIVAAKGPEIALCAPDRPGRQAPGREHRAARPRPSTACSRPTRRTGGFKRDEVQPARLRPAGRGRDQHGGRAADAGAAQGPAGRAPPCCWSATWTSCPRSGRGRCWPTSSAPARCRWCG